ncbi:MAG TPA: hypothetical protein VEB39_08275, partial [Sphingomicrobium sp.]|nr:hypothetical protein [Sphingomicrobium sp.]
RPGLFFLLCFVMALPILFGVRLGLNGALGGTVQTILYAIGACLLVGLAWLLLADRLPNKQRDEWIDSYLDQRRRQTDEQDPPGS